MYALIDGNSFYASCEQLFDPSLRRRPLIVASNNDGCAIARSPEAKALGIRMGHPLHELRDLIRHHGLQVRSANFALYGDISARVVAVLRDATSRVEVYSIDESFLDLQGVRDRVRFARDLRDRVSRWIGIPNCIGIGLTKTLAKAANKHAKRGSGVVDLSDARARADVLESFPVGDLWGVGPRWSARLGELGIATAAQLRDADGEMILDRFGVVLRRTQRELQGHACIALQEIEPDRQQIVCSRSFGERVTDHHAVAQALATFAERACAKARRRDLVCSAVMITAITDVFRPELPQHQASAAITLPAATSDAAVVLTAIRKRLTGFLREGYAYRRAGVALMDLARPAAIQGDLFDAAVVGNDALMDAMDAINRRFGRGSAGFAATGWKTNPAWAMRQRSLSPHYTTRIGDVPIARC